MLHKLYPDNWQELCDQLYSELHKQLRAEGYEDENGNRIEEAEHPLDFKKYEVTIKRDNGLGDLTTIIVNTSEDAVRDYVTGKGYEVVNIKELGYPGGNPENKNELQNKANKVVRNMAKMRESQTQEIDAVLKELKKKNPNIEKYLNEYYKSIADTEPRPAYDKEKDRMDPAWENWNKTTNNVLYSREAWENFTKWVKEKYNENLNEAEGKKGPTLEEDEYNAVDYFLTDSKMYDSGFYLKQDKNMQDSFVDAEDNKKYSLKNGLNVIYEAMVPEYVAEYPKEIQKGLEKVMRKYLGDKVGDEIKSWCSKPKKEAESIKTVCGLEDGKSYWAYVSKHGLGPGTIPEDVEAVCVSELPETAKTLFCVDRQLTPEELDKYELALFDNSYFNKYPEVVKELMALK